jgi:hypothetical protein
MTVAALHSKSSVYITQYWGNKEPIWIMGTLSSENEVLKGKKRQGAFGNHWENGFVFHLL